MKGSAPLPRTVQTKERLIYGIDSSLLAVSTPWREATAGGQQLPQDFVSACLIGLRTIAPSINSIVSE